MTNDTGGPDKGFLSDPGIKSDRDIVIGAIRHLLEWNGLPTEERETLTYINTKEFKTAADLRKAKSILTKHGKFFAPSDNDKIRNTKLTKDIIDKNKKGSESEIFKTTHRFEDGRIAEEIYISDKGAAFLIYTPEPEAWEIKAELNENGLKIKPRAVDSKLIETLTLPDGVEEYGSTSDLIREMESFSELYDHVNEGPIMKVWIRIALATHINREIFEGNIEKYASILRITGTSESGKRRNLTVMRMLVYRGMFFLKTTKVPTIFRAIEPWQGTLILDEADLANDSDSSEFIEYLNARATGTVIPRYSSEKDKVELWVDFGNTIVATRKAYNDDGVNSRTIAMRAEQTTKDIDLIPPPEWIERGRQIQRKLLLWRLRHLAKIYGGTIKIPSKITMKDIQSFRVKEAFLILSALSEEEPSLLDDILEIAKEIDKRLVEERSSSPTGLILSVIYGAIIEAKELILDGTDFRIDLEKQVDKEEIIYPLTLKIISEALGNAYSSSEIARYWRGLGQTVKDQERVEGKKYRGLVLIHDPKRLDREFKKYVVSATYQLEKIYQKQNDIDVYNSGTSGTSGTKAKKSVPDVPDVPPENTPNQKNRQGDDWQYFKVKESFSFRKYTYQKGNLSKFPVVEAKKYIEKGFLELPCPHGQTWDPNEKECIPTNQEGS